MYNLEMNNLELLLKKYENNFVLSDNIINDDKIEYLKFRNIVTVTDSNLVKVSSIKEIINFFQEKLNSKLILNIPFQSSLLRNNC